MKKTAMFLPLILVCLFSFVSFGDSELGEIPPMPVNVSAYTRADSSNSADNGKKYANDAALSAAFTLDYRPLKAEPVSEAETLSAEELAGAAGTSGSQGSVTGGGLRRLSDYQTVYFDPAREAVRIQAIRAAQEAGREGQLQGAANEPLTVIDWGPRGDYSSAIQRPSIYVIFSQPMIALASLGEPSALSPFVTITPALKGTFRWYGTNFLSFEGEEPCQSQQTYTITVASDAVSLSGNRISGDKIFSFHTEALSIKSVTPGVDFRARSAFYFDNDSVPPQAAKQVTIQFNYPVQFLDILQYLEILTNDVPRRFHLKQDDEYKITAELVGTVDFDTQVKVILKAGAKSRGGTRGTAEDQTYSYRTPVPFSVIAHNVRAGYGKYSNLVAITFSHRLNERTVLGAIRTEPVMDISNSNIEVYGNVLRLFNLPLNYKDIFTVFISDNIEDVYGRKLSSPYSCEIVMPDEPPPVGSTRFLYSQNLMMEAQFPPRYVFEYQNITEDSYYLLTSDKNPLQERRPIADYRNSNLVNVPKIQLNAGTINTRYFEEIDLSPYLNSRGRGFVFFDSDIMLMTSERVDNTTFRPGTPRKFSTHFSIQVTDLGLTVRYGFNRVTVLVTSLSTGMPVEGARVKLLSNRDVTLSADLDLLASYGSAVTDRNGLAIINMNANTLRSNTITEYLRSLFVIAEKDGDRAIFNPHFHFMWRQDIQTNQPQDAEEIKPVAFIFSDRGLYKPGETVKFRGVDRSKVLGMYTLYNGGYIITLEENSYRPSRIVSLEGTTTSTGSFFGQVELPEDLAPGSYRLVYRRADSNSVEINETVASIPITVAFFERLRFQATLSTPPETIILGDDINLTLRASYLSGGSLSSASWEAVWYEEIASFRPSGEQLRGFSFGPINPWDRKRNIGSESGTLSGQGSASLSRETGGGDKVTGAPYMYQAQARVTELGNQMVTAYRSVMAHPASFYIGLKKSASGFVRSGQEFSCNFITVDISGEIASNTNARNSLFLQNGEGAGQLKVELIREEWQRVQQRDANGYMRDEYTSTKAVDSVQMIDVQDGSGVIRVRPSSAGYHILRVSSKDREGRTALTEMGFYVTGSGGGYWNSNNPTELRLVPDQDVYEPGDTAKVLLQSALPQGYYLITVEREGIFTEEVRHFTESVNVIDIPIARNFVPVVYVSVSSYSVRSGAPSHEYGEPDLDKPKGYYGVARLNVNPRVKAFSVNIQTDKRTYSPGEEVTVTLTATRNGRPLPQAELSLMAIDRGVLDLINYHVPDPVDHFYSERQFPLFVGGGDSRSLLIDPATYVEMRNVLPRVEMEVMEMRGMALTESTTWSGTGFNSEKTDDESVIYEERSDFNATAVFEPMLVTDENGRVTCKFTLPDNLTTYRVTAFGVRGDLFALKESEIAAQNKINVREVVPRRLRERDTAEAGVLITNLDSSSHTITVKLDVGAPLPNDESSGLTKVAGRAFVDGTSERRITVRSGENAVAYFDVAAVRQGNITLNFTINSNVLNERLVREMIIEHPLVMETVTTTGTISGSSASEGLVIPSFADNGVGSLTLTLDATRLSLLDTAISYLFRYPYGCLEQRSSAVMPLVVFGEYLDALEISSEVSDPRLVVENELGAWAQIQLPNGGFPYWSSSTRTDFYVSLRIAHIIAIAKAKNFNIPSSLNVANLVSYLNSEYQTIQSWRNNTANYYYQSYLQSYMLYVSALLGESVDQAKLAEILSRNNVDPSVLAFVGMTYRALGRNSDAASTAQRLRNLTRMTTRGVDITDPLERNRYGYYYGTPVEQLALTLQFFAEQFPGDEINTRLLFSLLENQRSRKGYWQSTAVTVRVLSAVDALIRAENLTNIDVSGTVSLGAAQLLQGTFKGLGAKPVTSTVEFNSSVMSGIERDRLQQLNFSRSGRGSLYYTASLRYAIPSELQSFRDEGVGVFMSIHDVNTNAEISGTALQSGKTYRARIRVSSTRDRTYLALRVPVPSGAEILDMAFVTTASYDDVGGVSGNENNRRGSWGWGWGSWLSHQVIMDNEIQYFWDRFYKGESTVSFLFRTARRGVYPTPPAQAECMYEPEIFGRSQGLLYTIE
ncbi:MAG: alpha-2-macroglobulin [Treponema sp.]|jgi:uncharacterized protein YfaS (alpha-2-macroglobulin family)|nr:alpha-2-macroglobulin [Treponema sp.]